MAHETAERRIFNFSPGPAVMPVPVIEQAQRELLVLPGSGSSIMEISHRGKDFSKILADAKQTLTSLLNIPDGYHVLFLQGGARLQFSMVPMNILRGTGKPADVIVTGSWSKLAGDEARREGTVNVAWDGKASNYDHLPTSDQLRLSEDAAMVHFTSNETIQGVQFQDEPEVGGRPLICDASSDFLSRPIPVSRYGIIYACAQKNIGPAGVTVVVIRDDLLQRSPDSLPGYLNLKNHAKEDSCYNTPPTFAVYMVGLIARWLRDEIGGLTAMEQLNRKKAKLLYDLIDGSNGFFQGHAQPECRSMMNVTYRLPTPEMEKEFLAGAAKRGLRNLEGHRSVGGVRASIYNAMPLEGVECLGDYMNEFRQQHKA